MTDIPIDLPEEKVLESISPETAVDLMADLFRLGESRVITMRFGRTEVLSLPCLPSGWSMFVLGNSAIKGGEMAYIPRGGVVAARLSLEQVSRIEFVAEMTGREARLMCPLAVLVIPDALDVSRWCVVSGVQPELLEEDGPLVVSAIVGDEMGFVPTFVVDAMKAAFPDMVEDLNEGLIDLRPEDYERLAGPAMTDEEAASRQELLDMVFQHQDEEEN